MSVNGRQKGARAEREVAAFIQSWWRQLEPKCTFIRTPSSGGWATPELRSEYRASGDLMTSAQYFGFTVEVKRRDAWSLERLLDGKPSPVWGWWRQALGQAEEANAIPMLWFRHSREPWRVMMPALYLLCGEFAAKTMLFEVKARHGGVGPGMITAEDLMSFDPGVYLLSKIKWVDVKGKK